MKRKLQSNDILVLLDKHSVIFSKTSNDSISWLDLIKSIKKVCFLNNRVNFFKSGQENSIPFYQNTQLFEISVLINKSSKVTGKEESSTGELAPFIYYKDIGMYSNH